MDYDGLQWIVEFEKKSIKIPLEFDFMVRCVITMKTNYHVWGEVV